MSSVGSPDELRNRARFKIKESEHKLRLRRIPKRLFRTFMRGRAATRELEKKERLVAALVDSLDSSEVLEMLEPRHREAICPSTVRPVLRRRDRIS